MISTIIFATSTWTTTQIIIYNTVAIIALIVLLNLREILSAKSYENKRIRSFVEGANIATIPLMMVFIFTIYDKMISFI